MKNSCVIHVLLFILLMLVYQCTKAQDYVVLATGDTVKGGTKPLSFGFEKKVQVSTDKKKMVYSVFDVREFSHGGEIYHPVRGEKGYVFMKLIKPGYLSLYAFQMENTVTYDGLYLLKRDGSGTEVPNLSFKKQMNRFLEDCPDVVTRIDDGTLNRKELGKIVEAYNACVEKRTADHSATPEVSNEQGKKINSLDALEETVKALADFEAKSDALEMITEIKNKVQRNEKIPNFLLEGLKSSLARTDLTTQLEKALQEIGN